MKKHLLNGFMASNHLIPLLELESSPYLPTGFSYTCSKNKIESADLDPDDFYYNPSSTEKPFCYFKGFILLELPGIETELEQVRTQINNVENMLNAAVAQRDFTRFLSYIDKRIAPELFMEIFDFIPDTDKYPLFTQLSNQNEYCSEVFTADFIQKASRYEGASDKLPLADQSGYVQVFMSQAANSSLPNGAEIWHTDINPAIIKALQFNPIGDIYQGQVHLDHIRTYSARDLQKQVTVAPLQVEQIKHLDLIELRAFLPTMQTWGLMDTYYFYAAQIQTEWFHNPSGIHAISHTKRVLLLVLLLSYLEDLTEPDRQLLCKAAIYHDIGRKTDGYDTGHGMNSYQKLLDKGWLNTEAFEQMEILRFIIENHALPDQGALKRLDKYKLEDIKRCLQLYSIFKDADGLDRVRINDLNPAYLRTPSAMKLLLAAHQLYQFQVIEQLQASCD